MAYEIREKGKQRVGLVSMCKKVYQEPAQRIHVLNFYRGFLPTVLGMTPYAGVSFWAYHIITQFCRYNPMVTQYTRAPLDFNINNNANNLSSSQKKVLEKPPLTTWAELTCGGLAGLIAQTSSYPLEVKTRTLVIQFNILTSLCRLFVEECK